MMMILKNLMEKLKKNKNKIINNNNNILLIITHLNSLKLANNKI